MISPQWENSSQWIKVYFLSLKNNTTASKKNNINAGQKISLTVIFLDLWFKTAKTTRNKNPR
jgi:hypothetical protein